MKTFVIGDVHGCFFELQKLLDKIGPSSEDRIIFLGDLVDRGPGSPEVVGYIMNHPRTCMSVVGNHELKHIHNHWGTLDKGKPSRYFGKIYVEARQQFLDRGGRNGLPTYDEAVQFFRRLSLYLEIPEAILVHAGLDPHIRDVGRQKPEIVTGLGSSQKSLFKKNSVHGLFNWCLKYPEDAKPVIFGHLSAVDPAKKKHIHEQIRVRENLFPIDTSCSVGGHLTAVEIPCNGALPEHFRLHSVKAAKDYRT